MKTNHARQTDIHIYALMLRRTSNETKYGMQLKMRLTTNAYLIKRLRLGVKSYMIIGKQQNQVLPHIPDIVSLR